MVHLLSSFDISSILIAGVFGGYFGQSYRRFKSNPLRALMSPISAAIPTKLFHGLSINPPGNPLSRGDIPTPPAALPPTAQLPNAPSQSAGGRRAGRRRRGNGTILTGPRGLQSQQAGKTILGA